MLNAQQTKQIQISSLTVVFCDQTFLSSLSWIASENEIRSGLILSKKNFLLVCSLDKHYLVVLNPQEGYALQDIYTCIGLSNVIVCIELSNEIEAMIQKAFYETINLTLQYVNKPQLILLRQSYNQIKKSNNEYVRYCSSMPNLKCNRPCYQSPISIQELRRMIGARNVAKTRVVREEFAKLKQLSKDLTEANNKLSTKSTQSVVLPKFLEDKMIWKQRQVHRQRKQMDEESKLQKQLLTVKTIDLIPPHISKNLLAVGYINYTKNSLRLLKDSFQLIKDQKDARMILRFRSLYQSMLNALNAMESSYQVKFMQRELIIFMIYHEDVLNKKQFASLNYCLQESKYRWKYHRRIYYVFIIIIIFLCIFASYWFDIFIASF